MLPLFILLILCLCFAFATEEVFKMCTEKFNKEFIKTLEELDYFANCHGDILLSVNLYNFCLFCHCLSLSLKLSFNLCCVSGVILEEENNNKVKHGTDNGTENKLMPTVLKESA